jgi:predicted DNA-binding protein (UPF0251 family)
MPRPKKMRWVGWRPGVTYFKPQGTPLRILQITMLSVDELEALRLAHLLGYSQEQGAEAMNVSRATFGRILEQAHRKISEALVTGKAIQIQGGAYQYQAPAPFSGAGPAPYAPGGGRSRRGRWRHGQRR